MKADEIRRRVGRPFGYVLHQLEACLKRWTQPTSDSLLLGTARDLARSRGELIAENAFLRQQVIVLKRQSPRPKLRRRDRVLMVLLASKVRGWKGALLVVKPDTVLKWHRAGFRLFWRQKSKGKTRVPRVSVMAEELIRVLLRGVRMAVECGLLPNDPWWPRDPILA